MIKSIELRNWKTHKNTKLDFSKGTNILIGQMGSGKSSIMDAISFALFGTFPSIQHRRVNVTKLIRNKPKQEKDAYVKLNFTLDGNDYSIKREIGIEGKGSATIEKNGSYLQSQPQRVTEEIERILKVDYDIFSKAVYSEQNSLDYFLDLRSADRKKQIDGLLGLDKFATAQDNATGLINRVRDAIADTEMIAKEFDIKKAQLDLESLNTDKEKFASEKLDLEKQLSKNASARTKTEENLNSLKNQYNKKVALSKEIEGMKSRSALLESEIKKIEKQVVADRKAVALDLEKLQKDIEMLKKEDSTLVQSERKLNSMVATLTANIDLASREIVEKEKLSKKTVGVHKAAIEKSIASCNEQIEQISSSVAQSKAKAIDAEKQIKELEKHISKCPICEREIDESLKSKLLEEKKRIIADSQKVSSEHASNLETSRKQLSELTKQLNDLIVAEEGLKKYVGIDEKIELYKKSLTEAKAEYEKTKSAKDKSSKDVLTSTESLQKLKSTMESLDRRERYVLEKKTNDEELSKKTNDLNAISVDQKELDKLQNDLVAITSEISKHKANIDSLTLHMKDKDQQIKEKSAEIAKINKIKQDVEKKRSLVDNMSKFKLSLSETQIFLRSQLVSSINRIMHEVWLSLYPYGDYQSVMLDASDDDYKLMVKTLVDGTYVWEDVESIASGGERSTACLAMRIAFSLVLVPNLKWLILDEPTHNIDREGLSKFVEMFGNMLPTIVDQVFIITHDDMLKQVNGAKIYSFSRNKAENKETMVEEFS